MSESTPDIQLYNASVNPAIADLASSVSFPVKTGASTTAYNRAVATSVSNSDMQFNINVNPQQIIDRELRVRATVNVNCTVTKATSGSTTTLNYKLGESDALRPFPLNQMITVSTITVGSQAISLSQRDVFDMLVKCVPKRFLSRTNSTCPSYIDSSYKDYTIRPQGSFNDPLQGFEDALLADMVPNGAFPITVGTPVQYNSSNAVVAVTAGTEYTWNASSTYAIVPLSFTVDEPLFVSPFIFQNDGLQNKSGILGVNTFSARFNMTGDANHMFCSSVGGRAYSGMVISGAELHYKTHTAQNGVVLPIKSVIPYKQIDRYMTNNNVGSVVAGASQIITSPNINLGSIPDHFVIAVRKQRSGQTLNTASSAFFPINSITGTFNNQTNLLSSCTMEDLWRLSAKNGSTQSFHEFRGTAMLGTDGNSLANTIGSLVIVSSTDLQIPSPLAPSALANVVCNFQVRFTNNEAAAITPELVVMAVTDGVMTIMNGNVSLTTSLLTEGMVAQTLTQPSVRESPEGMYTKRGGSLGSVIARKLERGAGVMSAGGVMSGGAMSGGKTKSSLFY